MNNSFQALKGIGVVAIASYTFLALTLPTPSTEAIQTEPKLNFVLPVLT